VELKKSNKGYKKAIYFLHDRRILPDWKCARQRTFLNLGELPISREKLKLLANRIEEIVTE